MMGLIRPMVAACLVCGLLGAGPAAAEGGRITFSGAVVVPTCAAQAESVAGTLPGRSFVCGASPQVAGHADTSSVYRLSVVRLDGTTTAGSPLLQYFVGYRASMHAADAPQMVTRTYE